MKLEVEPILAPQRAPKPIPRVLVVDENLDTQGALARIAGREGLKVEVVATFEEAKRLLDREEIRRLCRFGSMIGASPAMQRTYEVLRRVAATEAPVLLTGETGSGKELAARTLHELSSRRSGPFLAINCGAISPNMIESEIFGHERGSFTGAGQRHRGIFERPAAGTLFLDEITEMTSELQVKLLRVLESGTLVRVGGEVEIPVDVRVIAATNRPPEDAVADGQLRDDLFYRLAVVQVRMPPLRERGDDIRVIAEHFLRVCNAESGTSKAFTPDAVAALRAHFWPGNVRELKNVVQGSFIMAGDRIGPEDLAFRGYGGDRSGCLDAGPARPVAGAPSRNEAIEGCDPRELRIKIGTSAEEAERILILATLSACGGRKNETARILAVSLKTLYNRLHKYANVLPLHLAVDRDEGLA